MNIETAIRTGPSSPESVVNALPLPVVVIAPD